MWRRYSVLLLLLLADLALATPPAVDEWSLWVDGPKLRGANIQQRRVYPFDGPDFLGPGPLGPPYTQEDFNRLAVFGANAVVLSHAGLFTEDPPYRLDPDVQASLDDLVAKASNAGLYVVIAFRSGPGRSEETFGYFPPEPSYRNERVWTDQEAHDAWPAMWRYTAARYRDNPAVVGYHLMVEPNSNGVFFDVWEPEDFYARYAGTLYDWNALYPSIIRAIREVDQTTPILVGGMSFSMVQWLPYLQPVSDPRVVYVVHFYAPFDYTHQEPAEAIKPPDAAWLRTELAPIDQSPRPVAIAEFGVRRWAPGAAEHFTNLVSIFEEKRANHFLWIWSASWPAMAGSDEFNFLHGPDPAVNEDVPTSALIEAIRADFARNARAAGKRRAVGR